MRNPLAEQGRKALDSHYFSQAREILTAALQSHPLDADILCEYLYCECYFGNEELACQRFDETITATNHNDLKLLLSRYFFCRQQFASKLGCSDVPADDWLAKHSYTPEEGIGIKLSACLITKNEEKVLEKCLRSLEGIADEIIVVDTGSTDRTIEIAQSFGATIGSFAWVNDFSAARNESLRLATGHWGLWIDADEQLDPKCKIEFPKGMVRSHIGGYSLQIVNYMDDSGTTSEFVHTPTRLFRLIPGVQFSEPIHEQITPSLLSLGLPWTPLDGATIHHDGYREAALIEKNKVERTTTILEQHVANNPDEPFQIFNLANAYFVGRRYEEAASTARRALRNLPPAGAEYGHAVYQVLATSLDALGRHNEALEACMECDRTPYNGIVNEYLKSTTLMNLGRFNEALAAVDRCLSLEWPKDIIGDKGIADFRRHALKGQIYGCISEWNESKQWFEDALRRQPGFSPAVLGLAIADENLGNDEAAKVGFESLWSQENLRSHCERGLGALAERAGNLSQAAAHFGSAWRLNPKDANLFDLWAAVLVKLGDYRTTLNAYEAFAEEGELTVGYFTNLANVHATAEVYDSALECYQKAIQVDAKDANTWFMCGDLLYRLGAYPDALKIYEEGLRLNQDHADGWFVLGNCLAQMNHDRQAVECYDRAITLDPAHSKAISNRTTVMQAA
jgi:tetratricopeptide (TPR) repeat protein